jgi:hypothetical protein
MISIFTSGDRKSRVKFKDIFDMKAFYQSLREWIKEHEYGDYEEGIERWETVYGERVGKGGAKEIWFQWRVKKTAPGSEAFVYYLDLDFHCIALSETEVVRDGVKLKVHKGEVELKIGAFIDEKYKSDMYNHWFLKHVAKLFSRRVYRKEVEQRKKELYQEVYVLLNFVKQWLKLKRYLPYEETKTFMVSKSWPSHLKHD